MVTNLFTNLATSDGILWDKGKRHFYNLRFLPAEYQRPTTSMNVLMILKEKGAKILYNGMC